MGVVHLERPLPLGVVVIYYPEDKKAQPFISSPKGTISMKKMI
jgi:hypothetical protein